MEKTEFIISENGTITERFVREREINAGDSVLQALASDVTRQSRNVFHVPGWGMAQANVGVGETVWSVPINRIPLKARFRLVNGVLVPMFASSTELEMPLVWQSPKDIRLVFVIRTELVDESTIIGGNWLFAYSKDNNGYRLPLPNLHDDCRICTGEFENTYDTAHECVIASLEQFNKSKWNSDLMRTVEQSQKFFRFRPTNDTFETLPIEATDWTTLASKVSTALMDQIIL
jgi:hypothetical protein